VPSVDTKQTTATISNLLENVRYYFVVRAYIQFGDEFIESPVSNEVAYTIETSEQIAYPEKIKGFKIQAVISVSASD